MKKIPEAAMPVVEVIRREVPRPKELPYYTSKLWVVEVLYPKVSLAKALRWRVEREYCCPMGLHPKSARKEPFTNLQFAGGVCGHYCVPAFGKWWDSLGKRDAVLAIDAIWGKE